MPSAYPAAIPRRLLTITVVWVAAVLVIALSPVLFPAAAVVDLAVRRRGWPTVRMVAFFVASLWIETTSLLRVAGGWLVSPLARTSWTERNHRLMHWWVGRLERAAG